MIGRTISHYTILEKLGEGGMGVVYKARDTHLNRFVAIKVLPAEKVADPERKQRFVQEAKAASSLNHPNIITIYDIGQAESVDFISMECVSGKTLDRLIPRHGMRLSEALKYAIQIADALARAHSAGIVHRDLKPGNIMVNEHGLVKVLDFGLAKLTEATSTGEDESTRTMRPWTEEGKIVGTVAYMSPEQAEGIKVDARADIFSFGSVLYEMVTGGQAFRRDTKAATLAAILKDNPRPASQLVDGLPGEMERLISRCLRKEVNRRFQHMDDLKVALLDLKEESDSGKLSGMTGSTLPTGGRKSWLAWAGGLVILFLMVAAGLWRLFLRREVNLGLAPKTVPLTSYVGEECCASFSPDGNQVAFVWDGPQQNNVDIYVKLIGTENMLRLTTDPTGDFSPAWSPDGRYIAFLRFLAENKAGVFLVPAIGGPQRKLAEISDWRNGGLTWYPDGKWLAVPDQNSISLLSVDTGEKRKLTLPPAENSDNTPAFSPDGQHLAFSRNVAFTSEIYLLALSRDLAPKGEPKQLTFTHQRFTWPVWTANGREIISSFGKGLGWKEDELLRLPIDDGGPPQPLSPPVQGQGPAISRRGDRLAYMRRLEDLNIWRVEMPGPNRKASEPVNLISSTYNDGFPQYSPDGKRVVFVSDRSGHSEIWACASDGSNAQQLTSLGAAGSPRWSPEGQRIVFDSNVEGQFDLYMIDADGGAPKRMTNDLADDAVASWSRDGRWIYFVSNRTKEFQVWKMPADGGEALQVTKHGGYVAFESLDGKFVYFSKDLHQTSIWRIPAGGGDEANISKSTAGFAVAGGGIYFITPHSDGSSALQFHNFATGKVTTVAAIHRQIPGGLSVSPDERYVLYTQADQSGTDLMLVEHFR